MLENILWGAAIVLVLGAVVWVLFIKNDTPPNGGGNIGGSGGSGGGSETGGSGTVEPT